MSRKIDVLNPAALERYLLRTNRLLEWTLQELDREVPAWLTDELKTVHPKLTDGVATLGNLLMALDEVSHNNLMYAKSGPFNRDLSRWWSEYRTSLEVEELELEKVRRNREVLARAVAKLDDEELKALGLTSALQARQQKT